jgi:hypothetical protein
MDQSGHHLTEQKPSAFFVHPVENLQKKKAYTKEMSQLDTFHSSMNLKCVLKPCCELLPRKTNIQTGKITAIYVTSRNIHKFTMGRKIKAIDCKTLNQVQG